MFALAELRIEERRDRAANEPLLPPQHEAAKRAAIKHHAAQRMAENGSDPEKLREFLAKYF